MHRQTDRIDEYMDLRDAIATLPTRQRRVVFLFSQGMTQCEIAVELDCDQATVFRMFEKAIGLLKCA